jgi:hypothetical protein
MQHVKLFAGYDLREAVGYHTFCQSVLENSSLPVSITPLNLTNIPWYSDHRNMGTNAFNHSRFLVPSLCDYQGWAIFADGSDMLCLGDITDLWNLRDNYFAVQLVKHRYTTGHFRKYIGTPMEADNIDYSRKNWSSLMLINCNHDSWQGLGDISNKESKYLHRFEFLQDDHIGELPQEWNHLVREQVYNPLAQIAHFTLGIPAFKEYSSDDYSKTWHETMRRAFNL